MVKIPNLQDLKYVIFDWDNTLANTRPLLVKTVDRVLAEYGLPEWEISKNKRDANLSFRDNFPLVFGNKATQAYELYRKLYLEVIPDLVPVDGAPQIVEYFYNKKIPILIMTNKDRFLLDKEIEYLYNHDYFLRVVAGHEAPRDKPYPEHAWYTLKGLLSPKDINRNNVWIIGDSHQDSQCAKSVNALPIRIGQPIWNCSQDNEDDAIYYSNFAELLSQLQQD